MTGPSSHVCRGWSVVPTSAGPPSLRGFYTPLLEDFYRAYVDSGIAFRPQRVCRLEALVAVVGW
jgi:hypothetical protein